MSEEKNKALKSIFKGASIVFIGVIISKLLGLIFRVLVGRTLGPAEYGVIALMMTVFSIGTTFGHMGIYRGVQRYVSFYRGEGDKEKMIGTVRTGYLLILIPAIVTGSVLFILSPWISIELLDEERLIWPIRMAAIALPFWGIGRVSISTTNALEKMQYKVYVSRIWVNFVEVILAVILIYFGYNYLGAAFAYAFGFASAAFLGAYFVRKVFPEVFSTDIETEYNFDELWRHSWPLFAAGIFGLVTSHIDTLMIQFFEGAEQVGFYQAAYPFAALLGVGSAMFSSIFLSRASYLKSKSEEDLSSTFRVVVKWINLVTIPIFLILLAYPQSVLILFGAEYLHVENILRVLIIGFLLNETIGPAKKVYQAVDKTRIITVLAVLIAALNFSFNILLIPMYGIMGAAVASTASFCIIFLIKIAYLYKTIGVHPFRLSTLKVILVGSISMLIVFTASNLLFETVPYWFLIIGLLFFGVLYILGILLGGILESEDLEIIKAVDKKTGYRLEPFTSLLERFIS